MDPNWLAVFAGGRMEKRLKAGLIFKDNVPEGSISDCHLSVDVDT